MLMSGDFQQGRNIGSPVDEESGRKVGGEIEASQSGQLSEDKNRKESDAEKNLEWSHSNQQYYTGDYGTAQNYVTTQNYMATQNSAAEKLYAVDSGLYGNMMHYKEYAQALDGHVSPYPSNNNQVDVMDPTFSCSPHMPQLVSPLMYAPGIMNWTNSYGHQHTDPNYLEKSDETKSGVGHPTGTEPVRTFAAMAADRSQCKTSTENMHGKVPMQRNDRFHAGNRGNSFVLSKVNMEAQCFSAAQQIFLLALNYLCSPLEVLFFGYLVPIDVQEKIMKGEDVAKPWDTIESIVRHLHNIDCVPCLSTINMSLFEINEPKKICFVAKCKDEVEVFQFMKTSYWLVDSPETSSALELALEKTPYVLLLFTVPACNKLVGCALVLQGFMKCFGDVEHRAQVPIRWLFSVNVWFSHQKVGAILRYSNNCESLETLGSARNKKSNHGLDVEQNFNPEYSSHLDFGSCLGGSGTQNGVNDKDIQLSQLREGDPNLTKHIRGESQSFYDSGNDPDFYRLKSKHGDQICKIIGAFSFKVGIHIDAAEYIAAEAQNRVINRRKMLCAGPGLHSYQKGGYRRTPIGRGQSRAAGSSGDQGQDVVNQKNFNSKSRGPGAYNGQQQRSGEVKKEWSGKFSGHENSRANRNGRGGNTDRNIDRSQNREGENSRRLANQENGTEFPELRKQRLHSHLGGHRNTREKSINSEPIGRKVKGTDGVQLLKNQYPLEVLSGRKKRVSAGAQRANKQNSSVRVKEKLGA